MYTTVINKFIGIVSHLENIFNIFSRFYESKSFLNLYANLTNKDLLKYHTIQ